MQSKYANPLENFVVHGVKTESADTNTYILLVDEQGQAVIKQVASDNSVIKFTEMPRVNDTPANIATQIDNFWAARLSDYTYSYLFQLQ